MTALVTTIVLSAIIAIAPLALISCAQFEDSFGELGWSDNSGTDSSMVPSGPHKSDDRSTDPSDAHDPGNDASDRQWGFTFEGSNRYASSRGCVSEES